MVDPDPRRLIPRTDSLLCHPRLRRASEEFSEHVIRAVIHGVQDRARHGELAPEGVEAEVLAEIESLRPSSLRRVINGTGVIVHTNLGRAPLSPSARKAVAEAAGYVDVEMDLKTGRRSRRGEGARRALLAACPAAEDVLVVNNGAAALALAAAALVGHGEIVLSRGELVEIGAGFRLPELIESTGVRVREVGATNRTHLDDYASALAPAAGSEVGAVLKVHPSNYRVTGFTSAVPVAELARLCREHSLPLIVDVGSGLLAPEPALPEEPDLATALTEGADLVIASGDKLLGGPQAGLLLGKSAIIAKLARHPLARAVRTDKLTLAALEATLTSAEVPVTRALQADPETLRDRTERFASQLGVEVVPHDGRVGGGGGAGVELPGYAVRLPAGAAAALRTAEPSILTRTRHADSLLDLRCVPEAEEATVLAVVRGVLTRLRSPGTDQA